jgi:hypothetical protein
MFVCWGLSAVLTMTVFLLNRHDAIKLRWDIAIRDITPEEMNEASSKLLKFSGQPARIVIFPVNFEANWIATGVHGLLQDAHWKVSFPDRLKEPPANGLLVQGIFIDCSNDEGSREAATALHKALNSTLGVSQVCNGRTLESGAFDRTKPLVWIFIGDKPTPLRRWIE